MSSKTISVEVPIDGIKKQLLTILKGYVHKDLLAEVIINNLEKSEVGIGQLFMAFSGVEDKTKYKVGDHVFAKLDRIYHYRIDRDKMKEAPYSNKGWVPAIVNSIDNCKRDKIEIAFKGIDGTGNVEDITYQMNEGNISLNEDLNVEGIDLQNPF